LQSVQWIGWLLVGGIFIECWLSWRLPTTHKTNEKLHFQWRAYFKGIVLKQNIQRAWKNPIIWLSIIGIAAFSSISLVLLANFPAYLKAMTGETDVRVANGIMALSAVGIVIGSYWAGRVSKGHIETGVIPIGALGICILLFWLPTVTNTLLFALLFTLYGICGGLFLVPLNALIQYHADFSKAGSVLAANNFIQNICMIGFLGLSILAAYLMVPQNLVFYCLGFITFLGTLYTIIRLPQSLVRYVIRTMLTRRYHIEVLGLNNLPSTGGVLLLGNHVSWLVPILKQ